MILMIRRRSKEIFQKFIRKMSLRRILCGGSLTLGYSGSFTHGTRRYYRGWGRLHNNVDIMSVDVQKLLNLQQQMVERLTSKDQLLLPNILNQQKQLEEILNLQQQMVERLTSKDQLLLSNNILNQQKQLEEILNRQKESHAKIELIHGKVSQQKPAIIRFKDSKTWTGVMIFISLLGAAKLFELDDNFKGLNENLMTLIKEKLEKEGLIIQDKKEEDKKEEASVEHKKEEAIIEEKKEASVLQRLKTSNGDKMDVADGSDLASVLQRLKTSIGDKMDVADGSDQASVLQRLVTFIGDKMDVADGSDQ